jgi:ATP-dependent DNA helicase RecG
MIKQQNMEYKSLRQDEYLKRICGFARAQNGTHYIGKDDNGEVVGRKNAKRLMEDLSSKITAISGIVADVNLHEITDGDFIEIVIRSQLNPVNYKGEHHYRTGNTKQKLKGAALEKFLLGKQGKHWNSVPNSTVVDLKPDAFDFFRKRGVNSRRFDKDVLKGTNEILLNNLTLADNGYLLLRPNPEKYATTYIKIGLFESDSDLHFQKGIHGNLFDQIEKTMEMLFTKYIKAIISYENSKEAAREALHNAVDHKDYIGSSPVHVYSYNDKTVIWNFGQLPESWTINTLQGKYLSVPHNPNISKTFYIGTWGGIRKMNEQCAIAELPQPAYDYASSVFLWYFVKMQLIKKICEMRGAE